MKGERCPCRRAISSWCQGVASRLRAASRQCTARTPWAARGELLPGRPATSRRHLSWFQGRRIGDIIVRMLSHSTMPLHWKPVRDPRGRREREGMSAFSLHPDRPPLRLCIDDTGNVPTPAMRCLLTHTEKPLVETMRVRSFRRAKGTDGWGVVRGEQQGWRGRDAFCWSWGRRNQVWQTRFSYLRSRLGSDVADRQHPRDSVRERRRAMLTSLPCGGCRGVALRAAWLR